MTKPQIERRIRRIQKKLASSGIDGLLVSSEPNVSYLSGYTGTESYLVVTARELYFLTDFRYWEQAKAEAKGYRILLRDSQSYPEMIRELCQRQRIHKLGFEASRVGYGFYAQLARFLGKDRLVETRDWIESLRIVKDAYEIGCIRKACEIVYGGMSYLSSVMIPGMSEREAQAKLEYYTKMLGSEKPAFDIIIACGAKSSMPHAIPDRSLFRTDDMVLVDMGVVYGGYHSDLTRCIFLGKIPRLHRRIYDTVLRAQERGIRKVRPGVKASSVDKACRDYIHQKGYGRYFGHSTGHGVGLEIHEAPGVSKLGQTVLEPGMIVTVEPGIYLPGKFGVRIEDLLLVTSRGCEVLTAKVPKGLPKSSR